MEKTASLLILLILSNLLSSQNFILPYPSSCEDNVCSINKCEWDSEKQPKISHGSPFFNTETWGFEMAAFIPIRKTVCLTYLFMIL